MRLNTNGLTSASNPRAPTRSYGMGVPKGDKLGIGPDVVRMRAPSGTFATMVDEETSYTLARLGWERITKARRKK